MNAISLFPNKGPVSLLSVSQSYKKRKKKWDEEFKDESGEHY